MASVVADCEDPSAKSIRCQYTAKQKQRVVLYARNHGVRPTEMKFSIPRKNIQRWLENFRDDGFKQSIVKRGPKKQRIARGRHVTKFHMCVRNSAIPL